MKTILEVLKKDDCCGCEACSSSCPKGSISMIADETGFLYPVIDKKTCINCGLCVSKCPAINNPYISQEKTIICGYARDEQIVQKSSSGGFFSLVANWFLRNGGVVYGVAWDEDFCGTHHVSVRSEKDFPLIVGSKYIQSKKEGVYSDVVARLEEGETVLFSGTPCEVSALRLLVPDSLSKNLYTIDLVCQGPSTSKAMRQYIAQIERKQKAKVTFINMRVPIGPWIPQHFLVKFENGKELLNRLYDTEIGDSIRVLQRPACYKCSFCGRGRRSDLTLGDYHGAKRSDSFYHESGVSVALSHTSKGDFLIGLIKETNTYMESCDYSKIASFNPRIQRPWEPLPEYREYLNAFLKKDIFYATKKTISIKRKFLRALPLKCRVRIERVFGRFKRG